MRCLLLLLLPSIVTAATIGGTVYDLELTPVNEAIITIDTVPEQRFVAKEGTYTFEVPPGEYELIAVAFLNDGTWVSTENITISSDGEYRLDLLLVPDFGEEEDLALEEEDLVPIGAEQNGTWHVPLLIAVLLVIAAGIYVARRKSTGESPDDEFRTVLLEALRKHGGRMTQRDLRKELPFSEAKVSLVLTELEAEGKLKKIKKGRGNIIVMR